MNRFEVGDVIKPTKESKGYYGVTTYPDMIEGVVVGAIPNSDFILVKVTKHIKEYEIGEEYEVDQSKFFLAVTPTQDNAFELMLSGSISEEKYKEIMKET